MEWITRLHRTSTSRDQSEIRHRNKKLLYPPSCETTSRARRKKDDLINEEKFIYFYHVEIITCRNIRFSDFFFFFFQRGYSGD